MLQPDNGTGDSSEWLDARNQGKKTRKRFTSVLKKHGVQDLGYGHCTNGTYRGLHGIPAKILRQRKGLDPRANVRDHSSLGELVTYAFAEFLSSERIQKQNCYGNDQCADVCYDTAKHVAQMADALLGNSTSEAP